MIRYEFDFSEKSFNTDEFSEASIHELKVLVVLLESNGSIDEDELIEKSGVSKARVSAAIALWQEAGVISPKEHNKEVSFYGNSVHDEFVERVLENELEEESAKSVAHTIRSHKLTSLFNELASMMGKPMLTPHEIKRISELTSQYELSEEYIATLAAHLLSENRLSISALVRIAIKLVGDEILNAEALAEYIADRESEKKEYAEYRRVFGIYNRKFSKTEKELLHKWSHDFAYGSEIIGKAYDTVVMNTGKLNFPYMDRLLTDWNANSCKTLEDCESRYKERKAEMDKEAEEKRADMEKRRPTRTQAPKPRYGDFDPEEAFKIALSRSFNDDEN